VVTALEQVAQPPRTPPRPDCIAREKALYPHAEVGTRGLDQKMKTISHDDVTWLTRSNNVDANEIDGDDDPNRSAALSVGCSVGEVSGFASCDRACGV
jgi:hypothetical protein